MYSLLCNSTENGRKKCVITFGLKKRHDLSVRYSRGKKTKKWGFFLHELQLYDSFRQKCKILGKFTAKGLKIQGQK
jgi:hypothetical protein